MSKILIAEDNQDFALLLQSILEKEEYQVHVAYDGDEAIEHLQDHSDCDLVLTDIIMPGTDGLDLIEFVKANSAAKIIAMSGGGIYMSSDRAVAAISEHVEVVLKKPFEHEHLLCCIADILKH